MKPAIPRTVWTPGFVSMFMDIPSAMIHSLLPAFMVSPPEASALALGVVEGVAESTAPAERLLCETEAACCSPLWSGRTLKTFVRPGRRVCRAHLG
jgi:hypothetical protein